jgi:hypothetical protein
VRIATTAVMNVKTSASIGSPRPRITRLVSLRFPGNVTSANPIRKIGIPPGPGTASPSTGEPRMKIQPMTFLKMNQK